MKTLSFKAMLFLQFNFKKIVAFTVLFLVLAVAFTLHAQSVDTTGLADNPAFEGDRPDTGELMNVFYIILGALNMLFGFIWKAFGLKQRVNKFVLVIIASGIVLGGVFVKFGLVESIPAVITLLTSMGLFDIIKAFTPKDSKLALLVSQVDALTMEVQALKQGA